MKFYKINDKEYNSLWELRRKELPNVVMSREPDVKLLEALGIEVIEKEPEPTVLTREQELRMKKREREMKAHTLTVVVDELEFNANYKSLLQMEFTVKQLRANGKDSIVWIMADNSTQTVTVEQLEKVIVLGAEALNELWVVPYEEPTTLEE